MLISNILKHLQNLEDSLRPFHDVLTAEVADVNRLERITTAQIINDLGFLDHLVYGFRNHSPDSRI